MVAFTSSMKLFEEDDDSGSVERFFVIDGPTVVFDARRVDTTSITAMGDKSVAVRLNLHDGTHVDKTFEVTPAGIAEKQNRISRKHQNSAHV